MGCFSWLCKKCEKGITSTSFDGQQCILFLLQKGRVVEKMTGRYNSYGGVFPKDGTHELLEEPIGIMDWHELDEKKKGNIVWEYKDWGSIVDDDFGNNPSSGIAAYHKKCYNDEIPTLHSESDPNQGWGEDDELFGRTDDLTEDEQ